MSAVTAGRDLSRLERAALESGALYVGAAALVVAAAVAPSLVMGTVIAGVTVQDEAGDGPLAWLLSLVVPAFAVVIALLWLRNRRRRLEKAIAAGRLGESLGLVRGALVGALISPPITAAIWLIGFTACAALVAREPNLGTRYAIVERDGKSCVARVVERQAGAWRAKVVVDEIETSARVDLPLDAKLLSLDDLRGRRVVTRKGEQGTVDGFSRRAFSPNQAIVAGQTRVVESLCLEASQGLLVPSRP
jgi:hypothetical protein